jgi:putative ATPase
LANAKKDRRAYDAYMEALADVNKFGNLPVPLKIRNPVTKLMGEVGYGKGYEKYDTQSYLPEKLRGKKYFKS